MPDESSISSPTATATADSGEFGTFTEDGDYVPRQIVDDDLGGISLEDAYDSTMVLVEDGQLVEGTVVRVDMDEVLLDIGYKSEGVIPARELSIRNDIDPSEVVKLGDYRGKPLIVNMVFTACVQSCPLIVQSAVDRRLAVGDRRLRVETAGRRDLGAGHPVLLIYL